MNIKKGDTVLVTAGKENGKTSTVLECFPKENKATVRGLNMISKHNKPRSAQDKGGIVRKEGKIDASNLMVVCPSCNKATRIKIEVNDDQKYRVCKHCGAKLDSGVKKTVEKKAKTEKIEKTEVKAEKSVSKKATDTSKHNTKESVKTATAAKTTAKKTPSTAKKVGGRNG